MEELKEIEIQSIQNLLSLIYTLPETGFFRGQSSVDFKLLPSVGRIFPDDPYTTLQFEKEIFKDFKRKYALYTNERPKSIFEFLFLAQHYGLPTRLLDWTYNPLIALFFATCSNFDKNGCIFESFPRFEICTDDPSWDPFNISKNYIVKPDFTDIRFCNQNALFEVFKDPTDEKSSNIIHKYIIPAKCKENIQSKLQTIGINYTLIYPSLDSLCKDIKEIHFERYKSYLPSKESDSETK